MTIEAAGRKLGLQLAAAFARLASTIARDAAEIAEVVANDDGFGEAWARFEEASAAGEIVGECGCSVHGDDDDAGIDPDDDDFDDEDFD